MSITLDSPRAVPRFTFSTSGPSRTDKSQAVNADIANIVSKFTRTGLLPQGRGPGQFADVSGLSGHDRATMISRAGEINDAIREEALGFRAARAAAKEAEELAERNALKAARAKRKAAATLDKEDKQERS